MPNEIYIAKEQTSQDIKSIVGKTNDTGGTTTTGTVVAKENAILTEVNKIGNIADIGGSATAGTVMGKLNALTDFNWNYQMVQRVKSSAVTTIPAPVASGTQGTENFGIEFDTPVPLDYIKINILSVPSGY
ncbi:MAG: hypothetical protein VB047_11955, partial [Anaerotignum propionicum]|uniref:hypothetical protein n=1 Tax=Anaerotignum propionicum TaxID=28446 RepID=UPI002B1EF9AF